MMNGTLRKTIVKNLFYTESSMGKCFRLYLKELTINCDRYMDKLKTNYRKKNTLVSQFIYPDERLNFVRANYFMFSLEWT